jgi:hypothetical protein
MTAKAKAKEPARGTADPSAALGMTTNGEDAKAKEKEPAGSQRDDGKGKRAGPSCVRINWKPARRRQRQKSRPFLRQDKLEAGATTAKAKEPALPASG